MRPVVSPREDAAIVLAEVMTGRERSTDILDRFESAYSPSRARDAALLHELVMGVLRRRLALLELVSPITHRPLQKAHPLVREIVLCMIYQALYLERIPVYASVSESVKAARRLAGEKAASFVNAIGRRLERIQDDSILDPPTRWSVPPLVLSRIAKIIGAVPDETLLSRLALHAPTSIRVNTSRVKRSELLQLLATRGIQATAATLAPDGVIIAEKGIPRDLVPTHAVPQDEASQLVVHALRPQKGERIADLCAGRGIKTTQIEEHTKAAVLAVDLDASRLSEAAKLAEAMGLPRPDTIATDIRSLPSDMNRSFDAVLLDAPCSGLGTLVRRPEVRYLRRESDFRRAMRLQIQLLQRALDLVRPGGRLVYAVCSFAPEEGPEVVARVLSETPYACLETIEGPASIMRHDGTLLTLPWRDGCDGFYIAKIRVKDTYGQF